MKNFRSFMLMALGLGLMLTGCKKDEGGNTAADNRDKVVGTYPVKVTAPVVGDLYANLTIAKDGEADLKASVTVDIPEVGEKSIVLVLSELNEYDEENGQAVTGYLYKIAEQEINIVGMPMAFAGNGKYADGYDGKIYKNASDAFISLEIGGAGGMVVKVETGTYTPPAVVDNRDEVVGTYPVTVNTVIPGLTADLTLVEEGDEDLKASTMVTVPMLGELNIELVLSELEEYDEEDGEPVVGYFFNIAAQELAIGTRTVTMVGTDEYDGYDGKVYKRASDSYISLKIASEDGTVQVEVVTTAAAE